MQMQLQKDEEHEDEEAIRRFHGILVVVVLERDMQLEGSSSGNVHQDKKKIKAFR
jgi:hypothetical protein